MSQFKIVLIATDGMIDFTHNALLSLRASQIDTSDVLLVVPESQIDLFRLLQTGYGLELKTVEAFSGRSGASEFVSGYAQYGTAAFSDLMAVRVPILRQVMEQHEYVVFSDVDIFWLRSPMEYLRRVLDHYDVAMQTEANEMFPPPFCMGFMAFKAGIGALSMLDWFQTSYEADRRSDPTATMQVTLNRIIKDEPSRAGSIFPLPEALFPNGRLYRLFTTGRGARDLAAAPEPFLFHANWTIGDEVKRDILRRCGMWALDSVGEMETARLSQELQAEKARNASLVAQIDIVQRRIVEYDTMLKERTEQAEQLLSHLRTAHAQLHESKLAASQAPDELNV